MNPPSRALRRTKWTLTILTLLSLLMCLKTSHALCYGYDRGKIYVGDGGCGFVERDKRVKKGFSFDTGYPRAPWFGWIQDPFGTEICGVSGFIPLLLFGMPAVILWRHDWRRRVRPGHCGTCGYNLTGNVSGRCPECGTIIGATVEDGGFRLHLPLGMKWWILGIVIAIGLAAITSRYVWAYYYADSRIITLGDGKIVIFVNLDPDYRTGWLFERPGGNFIQYRCKFQKSIFFWIYYDESGPHASPWRWPPESQPTWFSYYRYTTVVELWRLFIPGGFVAGILFWLDRGRRRSLTGDST